MVYLLSYVDPTGARTPSPVIVCPTVEEVRSYIERNSNPGRVFTIASAAYYAKGEASHDEVVSA